MYFKYTFLSLALCLIEKHQKQFPEFLEFLSCLQGRFSSFSGSFFCPFVLAFFDSHFKFPSHSMSVNEL